MCTVFIYSDEAQYCVCSFNPVSVRIKAEHRTMGCTEEIFEVCARDKYSSLLISASGDQQLSAGRDADWAGDREDRRSTTGVLLQLDDTTVAWRSIKQTTVAP